MEMEPVSVIVPVLVNVTDCAGLVFPTGSEGKVSFVGDSFTTVPVPVRATVCGLPPPLSEMFSVALLVPMTSGVNVTLIEQDCPAGTFLGHVVVSEKSPGSVPAMVIDPVTETVPVFVRVTDCGALLFPTSTVEKVRL